jgi:hypothetical protein
MSNFSKHGTTRAIEAAAYMYINKFMEQETAENLKRLRETMELKVS